MRQLSVLGILFFSTKLLAYDDNQIACKNLENLLFESQVRSQEMSEEQFKIIDNNLKQTFKSFCEEGSTELVQGHSLYYPNGKLATSDIRNPQAQWSYPDDTPAVSFMDGEDLLADILKSDSERAAAKIAGPFAAKHKLCAAGCGYVSWGIWGDAAHKKRKSCHNSGEAIDIHAITCGGKTYAPPTKKFLAYIGCMKKYFYTIYGNKEHKNHVHIQFNNCRKIKG